MSTAEIVVDCLGRKLTLTVLVTETDHADQTPSSSNPDTLSTRETSNGEEEGNGDTTKQYHPLETVGKCRHQHLLAFIIGQTRSS